MGLIALKTTTSRDFPLTLRTGSAQIRDSFVAHVATRATLPEKGSRARQIPTRNAATAAGERAQGLAPRLAKPVRVANAIKALERQRQAKGVTLH